MKPLILWIVFVTAINGCPNGWIQYDLSCYHFSRDTETWMDAMKICEIFQGSLVTVESSREENFIQAQVHHETQPNFWLGGSDLMLEGEWIWAKSQHRIEYTDWSPGEPNNSQGNQHCLAMRKNYKYKWVDDPCTERFAYICEKQVEGSALDIIG